MSVYLFDTGKYKNVKLSDGTPITSFKLREVDGRDEEVAANAAKAKGGAATSLEELMRLSIVEVNGQPTKQPYLQFDLWGGRARSFLLTAYRSINLTEDREERDFLAGAVACDPEPGVAP